MNKAEVLYFHAKLWDAAWDAGRKLVANTEHHGNVIVSVWAYKINCTFFWNIFCPSLPAKSQKKLNLLKRLLAKLQAFFVDVTIIVLTQQICILELSNQVLKLVSFKYLE